MTSEEAIEIIEKQIVNCEAMIDFNENFDPEEDNTKFLKEKEALLMAVKSIKEVQQYREIGTVKECRELASIVNKVERNELAKIIDEWISYRKIGTVKECREAREKQKPKKPVCKPKPYNESVGFNEEWFCPSCGSYIGYFYEGMDEPEQMEYCNECGQHIARDWSDENEDE